MIFTSDNGGETNVTSNAPLRGGKSQLYEEYLKLVARRDEAQRVLEKEYPQLFVSDEEINTAKKDRRKSLQDDPAFRQLLDQRAAAWKAQQNYLLTHDRSLAELQKRR